MRQYVDKVKQAVYYWQQNITLLIKLYVKFFKIVIF